jgi:hypothetical protein
MLQPFNSSTVSFDSNVTPNLSANNPFIHFMSLIASSWLGPVTITICEPLQSSLRTQSEVMNLRINSVTPNPVALSIHKCFSLNGYNTLSEGIPTDFALG